MSREIKASGKMSSRKKRSLSIKENRGGGEPRLGAEKFLKKSNFTSLHTARVRRFEGSSRQQDGTSSVVCTFFDVEGGGKRS